MSVTMKKDKTVDSLILTKHDEYVEEEDDDDGSGEQLYPIFSFSFHIFPNLFPLFSYFPQSFPSLFTFSPVCQISLSPLFMLLPSSSQHDIIRLSVPLYFATFCVPRFHVLYFSQVFLKFSVFVVSICLISIFFFYSTYCRTVLHTSSLSLKPSHNSSLSLWLKHNSHFFSLHMFVSFIIGSFGIFASLFVPFLS